MKLIFIPGSGGPREEWVYQTEYFAGSEAIALPGHPNGKPCSSIEEYTEWLRGYIQQHRYQDVVLIGHSMGGVIALLYGLKYGDELKSLVLIGSSAGFSINPVSFQTLESIVKNNDEASYRKYAETFYRLVAPETKRVVIEARLRVGSAVILNDLLCCDKLGLKDNVQKIKLPTLLICGSEDEKAPVEDSHYLTDKIEGAREVIIDGGTHWVFLEKPREVNRAIEEFVLSLS